MLEQGKISAAEADDLLAALEAPSLARSLGPGGEKAPRLHIRITDLRTGRAKTDVVIPTGMLGRKWARRLVGLLGHRPIRGLEEVANAGTKGTIVDVTDERRGERVEIAIEDGPVSPRPRRPDRPSPPPPPSRP